MGYKSLYDDANYINSDGLLCFASVITVHSIVHTKFLLKLGIFLFIK